MVKLSSNTIRSHDFAIWFFRIVILIFLTFASLIFFLRINDSVRILQGEIISTSPQIDYKAPIEGQLHRINVKEGQKVSKGDTLLVIQNSIYASEHNQKVIDIGYLKNTLQNISAQHLDISRKRTALHEEKNLMRENLI